MTDLDAILPSLPVTPPTLAGTHGKSAKCRRHDWVAVITTTTGETLEGDRTLHYGTSWECRNCGTIRDEARSRRGRNSNNKGKQYERQLAKKLGGKRTGMYGGPDDVTVSDLFVIQSKVRGRFPRWMADELAKLPRTGGRMPLLVVADSPGSAFRRTALVIIGLEDWIGLHGPTEATE